MNTLSVISTEVQTVHCVVVVGVGAEQGIGAAVCRRFAREQLKVYVAGRTLHKVVRVAEAINAQGGNAIAYQLDAEDEQQVQMLFDRIVHQKESLTAVVHNVGGNIPSIFLQTSLQFFNQMWRSTFLSAVLVAQRDRKSVV